MSAREAIKRLIFDYSRAQDSADFDAIGRLFAHGAFQATGGAEWRGEEIAERRRANISLRGDGTPGTKHVTTNVMIDADEDRDAATARSYFLILRQDDGGPLQPIGAGRYYDRFEFADGAWRFAHRRAYVDLQTGLDQFRRVAAPETAEAMQPGPGAIVVPWMPQPPDSRDAIETLLYTYAERMDLADFDGVGRLFAQGWFRGGAGTLHGEQVVAEGLRSAIRVYPDGTLRTKHFTTNVRIDLDEVAGYATARSYFAVFQATPELPLQPIAAGRYFDRFECADGLWRFADRRIETDRGGNLEHHSLRAS